MNRGASFSIRALVAAGLALTWFGLARADGRAGSVEWSDGRKLAGAISLTPGMGLRIFTPTSQVLLSVSLDEVKEIRFKPEKEEMWEGFYFPNPGQAVQAKTGDVYPIRYLQTEITLGNGKVLAGHLMTTVFYIETDDATEKVVVMAKQTGSNGQKLADLIYPTAIRFDANAASAGFLQLDLTGSPIVPLDPPVFVAEPDLAPLPVEGTPGKPIWTVPAADPGKILFSVDGSDGIHVAWPDAAADPVLEQSAQAALDEMRDFYDSRAQVGCLTDAATGDIYSLAMLKRTGPCVDGNGVPFPRDTIPWSLVILRWKYDPDQRKATLLNRVLLKIGRKDNQTPFPAVFKQPELFHHLSASK